MEIRPYKKSDEKAWLRCRLLSFYDTSYYDHVIHEKDDTYSDKDINLVALENEQVIGFIDIEVETQPNQVCNTEGALGAMIWDFGVLPEYRQEKIGSALFERALTSLKEKGINRLQAWTQDDLAANAWYKAKGFKYLKGYLNVFGAVHLTEDQVGDILGVRSINFEADLDRKEELQKRFKRIHEVRLYELTID